MYFANVITKDEQYELVKAINMANLNYEGNDAHYADSYGTGFWNESLGLDGLSPVMKTVFERLTTFAEREFGKKLAPSGLYGRVNKNGAKLGPHIDREELEYTASLCLIEPDLRWFLHVETQQGKPPISINIEQRAIALMNGRKKRHWRDTLVCDESDMAMYLFFHWKERKEPVSEVKDVLSSEWFYQEDNFISEADADKMISLIGQATLIDSMVKEADKVHVNLAVRSNKTTAIHTHPAELNNMISEIDRRVLNIVGGLSPGRLEGAVILVYNKGQYFVPHMDCNHAPLNDREYTYILYLDNTIEGGETVFVNAGISVTPKKGRLIVWRNMTNGVCDSNSMHEAKPVTKGKKTVMVNWIFQRDKI